MGAELGLDSRLVAASSTARRRSRDRWFFTGMAVAFALTVFIGFSRTYYLMGVFGAPALSTLVHLHGILFTLWIVFLLGQTSLVAARRVDLHRRFGPAGGVLAVVMLLVGYLVAVEAARRGVSPPGRLPPLVFLAIPLGALVVFATLVGLGLYHRRRSETHKRLMLLGTIALLTPAIARMHIGPPGPLIPMSMTSLFVVACLVYDRAAHGRIHPAFLWGGLFLILSMPLRVAIGHTGAWLSFAGWLTR